ncbi:MAG: PD40 domain-containing protein, partial [Anaerolineae bacterium]|nr:PD40 domain-containing protein [Anaerolineae bacterium]
TNSAQADNCKIPSDFTGKEIYGNWSPGLTGTLNAIALSPDGTTLAASTNTMIYLYDPETLTELTKLEQPGFASGGYPLAWSPDGTKLATFMFLYPDSGIRIWDMEHEQIFKTLILPGDDPGSISYSLAWSPDGTKIAVAGLDTLETRVWDVEKEKLIYQATLYAMPALKDFYGTSITITWSPDGQYLAFLDGTVIRIVETTWTTRTQMAKSFTTDMRYILGLAWSKSDYLAAVGISYSVLIWDTNTRKLFEMPGSDQKVHGYAVSWSPDETLLAVGRGTIVDIIDFAEQKIVQQLPEHNAPVYDMIWLPDNQMLTRTRVGWIFRWNLTTECVEAAVRVIQE